MYDLELLNVTLPDPIGYLYLSVSMPATNKTQIRARTNVSMPRQILLTCVDDPVEEIVHDLRQAFGVQHTVKGADEHGPLRVQFLGARLGVVGVAQDPRYHLNL